MTPTLLNHDKWKYSTKMWYSEYHICVELGPFPRYPHTSLVPNNVTDSYRERSRFTNRGVIVSVYTSSEAVAEAVITYNSNRVHAVKTPINQEHMNVLKDGAIKVEIKDRLYYGKYKFKIHTLKNYSFGFQRETWNDKCREVNKWISYTFSDTRTQRQSSWTYAYFGVEYVDVDYIYTNDEMSMMLYKMAYGDDFHIEITRVFVPQDFASV